MWKLDHAQNKYKFVMDFQIKQNTKGASIFGKTIGETY